MTQESSAATAYDSYGFAIPDPEAGRKAARQELLRIIREDELVWLVKEAYNPDGPAWQLNIVRQSAGGHWAIQRFRYDTAAEVLYFLGESPLSNEEFRAIRTTAPLLRDVVA